MRAIQPLDYVSKSDYRFMRLTSLNITQVVNDTGVTEGDNMYSYALICIVHDRKGIRLSMYYPLN